MARVCEQAQRYNEMVTYCMSALVEKGPDSCADEGNLFSVACKSLINSKRTARRTVMAVENNPKYEKFKESLTEYKLRMEKAIIDDSNMIIKSIRINVLDKPNKEESRAFFFKMTADYLRYQCEVMTGDDLKKVISDCRKSYEEAMSIAIPSVSQVRLGLVLNFAVFFAEVLNDKEAAC